VQSDPFIVVYIRELDGVLRELGRTEVICNNLNPIFVKTISMVYKFEEVQHLVFRAYDVDTFTPAFDNNNTSRLDLSKQVRRNDEREREDMVTFLAVEDGGGILD